MEVEKEFAKVEAWVESRLGMVFDAEQRTSTHRRMRDLIARLGLGSPQELLNALRDSGKVRGLLAEALATHHTAFFREPRVLERFSQDVLQDLLCAQENHRIWSAASSTGQEAYSVAVLLLEKLGAEEAGRRFSILGTDLVQKVVATAEAGRYSRPALTGVSPERLDRWFRPTGPEAYEVSSQVRGLCTFRRLNLLREPWPFSRGFSVIFCRNVLYYFRRDVQARLIERMYDATESGGWLLTGVSESLRDLKTRWKTLSSGVHRKV